jgi:hypothetical protein
MRPPILVDFNRFLDGRKVSEVIYFMYVSAQVVGGVEPVISSRGSLREKSMVRWGYAILGFIFMITGALIIASQGFYTRLGMYISGGQAVGYGYSEIIVGFFFLYWAIKS